MKKQTFTIIAAILFSLLACEKENTEPINTGLLVGTIGIYEGNCQPVASCTPSPISTTVAITTPSENFNISLLVDSIVSSSDGTFSLVLPEGNYSLFLRDGNEFVCNNWSCFDNDCYCTYFEIIKDSTISVNANIDHATW